MSSVKIYAAPLIYRNVGVLPSSWTVSTTYVGYPYEATIALDGVTEDYVPEVSFASVDALNYMFAPNAITHDGSMTIYAAIQPESMFFIPSIICVNGTLCGGGDIDIDSVLDNNSWETISAVADAGVASSIWNVGDTKKVVLNGTVGTLNLNNYETYVYIIGFDHNGAKNSIDFGTFKTADGVDMCLVSNYSSKTRDGTLNFNMNHWGIYCYGGWAGCDLRYDILGSTNIPPSGYGADAISSRIGYDANPDCIVNPVPNTLMAALPSELRTIMKPMTIYSDNVGDDCIEEDITASIDYLPLFSEFEVFGTRTHANNYEQNYQRQYDYYANGNSKKKYRHTNISAECTWASRSVKATFNYANVSMYGSADASSPDYSYGLAPIFRVGAMPIITFTINEKECKAVFGMTWAEWCESEYNTLGLSVNEYGTITNDDGNAIYFDGATNSNEFIEIDRAYNLGPL